MNETIYILKNISVICTYVTNILFSVPFQVARRFIASVVRIFVILAIEMMPNAGKKKPGSSYTQPLAKCIKVKIRKLILEW